MLGCLAIATMRLASDTGSRYRSRRPDHGRKSFLAGIGGAAVAVTLSVTISEVREDGTEAPVDGELAAALAGPAEQFAGLLAWAAGESGFLDHGEREEVIGADGRELQAPSIIPVAIGRPSWRALS